MLFPYTSILKQAYDQAVGNFQVWVFGVFVSFASGFHFLLLNTVLDWPGLASFSLPDVADKFWNYWRSPWIVSDLVALAVILLVSALCKAALIWSAQRLAVRQPVTLKSAAAAGGRFAVQVMALQLLLLGLFLLVVVILASPVIYLVTMNEIGRTVALGVLALAILVPVSVLSGFMFLYSPIIVVLYRLSLGTALGLAFQLATAKLKESLVMGALLVGIWLGFMMVVGFGIIVMSVPVAFLFLVLAKLGLAWALYLLIFSTGFLGLCALVVLSAGLAVFNNFAWTLAVMEMLKTEKHPDATKVLSAEAEPAA